MRTLRLIGAVTLLAAAALTSLTGTALADDSSATPDPSASATGSDAPPTQAGTDFRTATVVGQGVQATADASAGDYLYWQFPADTGQHVTVHATVTFPTTSTRHGASSWQVDVYDGLRRRQPCRYGTQTATAAASATSVDLVCHLRTIRSWAEPWSNDPLRGAYYVRVTVLDLPSTDLGQPVHATVEATSDGTAGSQAVDGSVAPVVTANGPRVAPSDGWAGTWWSPRWLWTGGGGLLAILLAFAGHRLARGPLRPPAPSRPPMYDRPDRPREPAGYGD
ncbi:hypothetical protein SAMN05216223_108200 [Actinacidiphila yanglinensis]|uniref:Secreted protein n=1 Tax=Actinacidiphila yanglinensis TaxID=310779 RepID=A0A1H6C9N8_9ACTN|nr:hypothetical protein [Actinacidiphila yanglinensis]SEG69628.1 hypothetical protein SAMN05216223_108200 [Actinacidiphila yanglinensis]